MARRAPKLHMVSLGCSKNRVDSEVMIGLSQSGGWSYTPDPEEADAIVVNTCAFIGPAREESVNTVLEYAGYKKARRGPKLIVTGCLTQRYPGELEQLMPEVDAFLGSGEFHKIMAVLGDDDGEGPRTRAGHLDYLYDETTPRTLSTHPNWAYVKIAEGCDQKCAFCIIPQLRGGFRSRTVESVVQEAKRLAARGIRELNLISQDTTSYGLDLAPATDLNTLLRALDAIEGIEWIRIYYNYPIRFSAELIDTIAGAQRIVPYIDMPVQHISDEVLGRMRRRVNARQMRTLLSELRTRIPNVALRTTLLVGFPGETAAHFGELESFVREFEFDHLGVFPYSFEENTPSATMDGQVPEAEREERRARLMTLQQGIVQKRLKALKGQTRRFFVEGPAGDRSGVFVGRIAQQGPEEDGVTEVKAEWLDTGSFHDVVITGHKGYDLKARLAGNPA